ncbi:hypothetical protein ZIOFF_025578 [Zingiber officinale]|uniref:RRM domain-containing protein n=1 Tax=Zingiber officinale TaxID=94328 RepID=A0A8J5LJW2_ZINOF|nr:hypothetical protein ZIOFF_025578 [Zingiber officinale]
MRSSKREDMKSCPFKCFTRMERIVGAMPSSLIVLRVARLLQKVPTPTMVVKKERKEHGDWVGEDAERGDTLNSLCDLLHPFSFRNSSKQNGLRRLEEKVSRAGKALLVPSPAQDLPDQQLTIELLLRTVSINSHVHSLVIHTELRRKQCATGIYSHVLFFSKQKGGAVCYSDAVGELCADEFSACLCSEAAAGDDGDEEGSTPGQTSRSTPSQISRTFLGQASRAFPGQASRTFPDQAFRAFLGQASRTFSGQASRAFPDQAFRAFLGQASRTFPTDSTISVLILDTSISALNISASASASDTLVPTLNIYALTSDNSVDSPIPPFDKIGVKSVQREKEEVIPMKTMKMAWVPYIPLEDRETGQSKGFGFVTFTYSKEASASISGMDGKNVHGRMIRVNYTTDQTGEFHGGGYGGSYGSGGYGGGGGAFGGGYGALHAETKLSMQYSLFEGHAKLLLVPSPAQDLPDQQLTIELLLHAKGGAVCYSDAVGELCADEFSACLCSEAAAGDDGDEEGLHLPSPAEGLGPPSGIWLHWWISKQWQTLPSNSKLNVGETGEKSAL